MTQSSADTSFSPPPIPPVTPLRSSVAPAPIPHPRLSTHHGTHIPSYPQPSTPPITPHSFFDVKNNTALLSPHSRHRVMRAIKNGWAKSTVKRYSSSIRQYIRFCDMEGIPEHLRFPADEFVLCAFAAASAGIYARSTPRNQLSALKAWHVAHNLSWNGSSRLRYVLNGVHNLTPRVQMPSSSSCEC